MAAVQVIVEEAGGKMTVTAIALKGCASALKVFPTQIQYLLLT